MKQYELIQEQYNTCSGRPVTTVREIEADDPDAFVRQAMPPHSTCAKTVLDNGSVVYDVVSSGIRTKYTLTEL